MLVLSRKVGEKIRIGLDIEVEVLECYASEHGNGRVRLGLTAPADVKILRTELIPVTEADDAADARA